SGNIWCTVGGSNAVFQSDSGTLVLGGNLQYVGTSTNARAFNFLGAGNTVVTGDILNSTNGAVVSLAKSGPGTLSLNGNITSTGATTVAGGALLVNGFLLASPVIIANTATLGGSGVINTALTVPSGATLAPGAALGTLTVNNNVTLQPGSTTRIELDK